MNFENIDKLIEFIANRTEKTKDYGNWDQCVIGMAGQAFPDTLLTPFGASGLSFLLDISFDAALGIVHMSDRDELYISERMRRYSWGTFNEMSLEQQNAVLTHMLDGVKRTGVPDWSLMPKRSWIARHPVTSFTVLLFIGGLIAVAATAPIFG